MTGADLPSHSTAKSFFLRLQPFLMRFQLGWIPNTLQASPQRHKRLALRFAIPGVTSVTRSKTSVRSECPAGGYAIGSFVNCNSASLLSG